MSSPSLEEELTLLRARVAELEAAERSARDAAAERDRIHALYRAIVERAPIGLGIADEQGELLVYNAAMMAVSGFAPSEVERWKQVRQSDAARATRKRLLEVAIREGLLAHELQIPRPDGTSSDAVVTARPEDVGGARYLHVTMQDVTELRRVERALRESELRFRQLAETIRQVFYITTPDHRQVLYVSPAYEEQWGRSCESLYASPRSWVEAIHPEDRGRVHEQLARGARAQQYAFEYRMVRPDGSIRWVADRAFELRDASGEVYRLVGVAEDITDRRRLEENLRDAQKMDAMGQLAGGVAHDFNNLLTSILCNVAVLMQRTSLGDPRRERLEEVKLAADRAAELTKKLLGFSRRAVLSLAPLDVRAIVRETAAILRHTLDPRVRLVIDEAEDLGNVLADAGGIVQVLLNLALNGRDAMPEGGTLTLRTRACVVSDEQASLSVDREPGEAVCLTVEDSGKGIAPEVHGRIFEPFFTTKNPGEGTGLGLAVVFGIVKQHRGWVELSSEVGRGTRFDVYLPRHLGPAVGAVPSAPVRQRGQERGTILFVDDDEPLRRVARAILSERGYRVILAEDGVAALAVFEREWRSIDLVVLDLRMPRLSGRDTLDAIWRVHPATKVLVSSGHTTDHERLERTERIAGSLRKPYGFEELTGAVRAALGEEPGEIEPA